MNKVNLTQITANFLVGNIRKVFWKFSYSCNLYLCHLLKQYNDKGYKMWATQCIYYCEAPCNLPYLLHNLRRILLSTEYKKFHKGGVSSKACWTINYGIWVTIVTHNTRTTQNVHTIRNGNQSYVQISRKRRTRLFYFEENEQKSFNKHSKAFKNNTK